MKPTDANTPNAGHVRWWRLTLPAVAVAIAVGLVVWQSWPGPDDRTTRGVPARDTDAADAHADALMARSRDLTGQYLQMIARFPTDRSFDRALPDEVRRLASELDDLARQHLQVMDELATVRRDALSPRQSAELARHLTAAQELKGTMAQITDKLKQKLGDAPKPPEKAKDG